MTDKNTIPSSADKILEAATLLFAHDTFSSVSIKKIAAAS